MACAGDIRGSVAARAAAVIVAGAVAVGALVLPSAGGVAHGAVAPPDGLRDRLATAFRSDVASVRVGLDYLPGRDLLRGGAELRFVMRPGHDRFVFHFNPQRSSGPAAERRMLRSLRVDGERLDPRDPADLRIVRPAPGAEPAFEVQRSLAPGRRHRLTVTWVSPAARQGARWLLPRFDDTEGPSGETETMWPTVSSPETQMRHRIRLRVHSARPYRYRQRLQLALLPQKL